MLTQERPQFLTLQTSPEKRHERGFSSCKETGPSLLAFTSLSRCRGNGRLQRPGYCSCLSEGLAIAPSLGQVHGRVQRSPDFFFFNFQFYLFIFWTCCEACGMLIPRPGIEPVPSAVKTQSPNLWTAREFLS